MSDLVIGITITVSALTFILTVCNIFCNRYFLKHSGKIHVEIKKNDSDTAVLY